ncbi:MAG: YabP/YqfC family sporulation protein [Clostridia bacterium]|nr:YabP/YqfC family sporulation protein [Clostridia bacterium]
MAIEEKSIQRSHSLRLDSNKALSMSGVKNVPTFNDKQIVVELGNQNLLVGGDNLNISSLDLEGGTMSANGHITSLRYVSPHDAKSFFSKVFK